MISHRSLVRFTDLDLPTEVDTMTRHVAIATARLESDILYMEVFCGNQWDTTDDPEVLLKSARVGKQIEERCGELGLELRGGMFEEVLCSRTRIG